VTEQVTATTRKPKSFSIYHIMNQEPGAKEFLESIARNSRGSQLTYAGALLSFHNNLRLRHPNYTLGVSLNH